MSITGQKIEGDNSHSVKGEEITNEWGEVQDVNGNINNSTLPKSQDTNKSSKDVDKPLTIKPEASGGGGFSTCFMDFGDTSLNCDNGVSKVSDFIDYVCCGAWLPGSSNGTVGTVDVNDQDETPLLGAAARPTYSLKNELGNPDDQDDDMLDYYVFSFCNRMPKPAEETAGLPKDDSSDDSSEDFEFDTTEWTGLGASADSNEKPPLSPDETKNNGPLSISPKSNRNKPKFFDALSVVSEEPSQLSITVVDVKGQENQNELMSELDTLNTSLEALAGPSDVKVE